MGKEFQFPVRSIDVIGVDPTGQQSASLLLVDAAGALFSLQVVTQRQFTADIISEAFEGTNPPDGAEPVLMLPIEQITLDGLRVILEDASKLLGQYVVPQE